MEIGKRYVAAFSIASIVFLAGCASQTSTGGGPGVIMSSFSPELAEVDSSTTTSSNRIFVSAVVKNLGGADAELTYVELLGLPTGTQDWRIGSNCEQLNDDNRRKMVGDGKLFAANPDVGLPEGEEDFVDWELCVPVKDSRQTYDLNARLYYQYRTTASFTLRAVSLDYFRSLSDVEKENMERGIVSSSVTTGPLVVSAKAPEPLVGSTTPRLPIQIEIQNIGGGGSYTLYREASSFSRPNTTTINKAQVDVIVGSGTIECREGEPKIETEYGPGVGATTAEQIEILPDVRFVGGKSARINCVYTFPSSITTFSEVNVKVDLKYKYFEDYFSEVTVLKKFE